MVSCLTDVNYHIAIKTGSVNGASSDSRVFVKLYGDKCDTNKIILAVSDNDLRNYFETGQTDIFILETFDVGKASSLFTYILHKEQSMWFRLILTPLPASIVSSEFSDQPSSDWSHQ